MKKFKNIFYSILILVLVYSFIKVYIIIGGLFPEIGKWKIEATEREIIDAVRELRAECSSDLHPITKGYVKTRQDSETIGFWFCYSDTKELLATSLMPTDKPTIKYLHLSSIFDSNGKQNSVQLHGELNWINIAEQLYRFDYRIVNRIEQIIKDKRRASVNPINNKLNQKI